MDKLKGLLQKQQQMTDGLLAVNSQVDRAKDEIILSRGVGLYKLVREFGELFKTGIVAEKFSEIREQMLALKEVDSGYLSKLGTDAYGQNVDSEGQYISVHLFGSVWRDDASLWRVLEKVADSTDLPGNPFVGGE